MSADNVGSVSLGVNLDQSGLKKSLVGIEKQATSGLKSAFSGSGIASTLGKLGALAAGAFAIGAITRFGASAIQLGSDLAEVQNVVDVTFGSMSGQINSFAQSAMTSFGLSETAAKRYTGTMGAMLKSMGLGVDKAADMSMAMTGLAGDFASFYNLDAGEAFAKIRAGISGETEPLKQLGINMSVANLEAFGLSQGINKSYNAMTQAEQALLRYNYLMQVSADAQGDFARTSTSWANQTRVLKLQWDSFKASFGQGLINLFSPILVGINRIMGGLIKLGAMFSAFTSALFGTQKAAGGLGQSLANIANSGGAAADGQSALADATKAAGKAASGSVAGFDEVTVLQDKAASGGASAGAGAMFEVPGAGGGTNQGQDSPLINTNPMEAAIAKLKGLFNFDNIKQSWANLKAALTPLGENIGSGLKWVLDNVLVPFGAWVANAAAPAFLNALAGGASLLNSAVEALKPLGLWLWDSFLQPIATWTGGVIVTVLDGLATGLKSVSDWISNNQGLVQGMTVTVGAFFLAWKATEILAFIQMSGGLIKALGAITTSIWAATGAKLVDKAETMYLTALYAKDFVASLAKSAVEMGKVVVQFGLMTGAKIFDAIKTAALSVATGVMTAAQTALNFVMSINPIGLVILAIAGLVTAFVVLWNKSEGFRTFVLGLWDDLKAVGAWIGTTFYSIWTGLGDVFENVWNGIKKTFVSVMNVVIGGINKFIKGFLSPFNAIIEGLNALPNVNIPKLKLSIPSIPALAQGGIVSQPTLAMVGDNKRSSEAVAPLHELMAMIKAAVGSEMSDVAVLLSEIARILTESQSGGGQGDVELNIDGVTLARLLRPYLQREESRIGNSVISMA